jgi:hypothetical protein
VMDNPGRPPLPDGHIESVQYELGLQVRGHGSADDSPAPGIEHVTNLRVAL